MLISVDLTKIHDSPAMGRVAAVALLSALPEDEAQLAVDEWRAVLRVSAAQFNMPLPVPDAELDPAEADAPVIITGIGDGRSELIHTVTVRQQPHAGTRLEDVLTVKTTNALKKAGYQVLSDLEACTGDQLLATVDRFGKGALAEVQAAMADAGLALRQKGVVPRAKPIEDRAGPPTPRPEPGHEPEKQAELLPINEPVADIADTLPFVVEPTAAPIQPGNGGGQAEPEDLRAVCRRGQDQLGRERMMAILAAAGITKISEATAEQDSMVRNAVAGNLAYD